MAAFAVLQRGPGEPLGIGVGTTQDGLHIITTANPDVTATTLKHGRVEVGYVIESLNGERVLGLSHADVLQRLKASDTVEMLLTPPTEQEQAKMAARAPAPQQQLAVAEPAEQPAATPRSPPPSSSSAGASPSARSSAKKKAGRRRSLPQAPKRSLPRPPSEPQSPTRPPLSKTKPVVLDDGESLAEASTVDEQPINRFSGASEPLYSVPKKELAKGRHQIHVVSLKRQGRPLGFSIVGGSDTSLGTVHIKTVYEDSPAAECGQLFEGDRIVSVDGQSFDRIPHADARTLFKHTGDEVLLEVAHVDPAQWKERLAGASAAPLLPPVGQGAVKQQELVSVTSPPQKQQQQQQEAPISPAVRTEPGYQSIDDVVRPDLPPKAYSNEVAQELSRSASASERLQPAIVPAEEALPRGPLGPTVGDFVEVFCPTEADGSAGFSVIGGTDDRYGGVFVSSVFGSNTKRCGLCEGDRLVSFRGTGALAFRARDAQRIVGNWDVAAGSSVPLVVQRLGPDRWKTLRGEVAHGTGPEPDFCRSLVLPRGGSLAPTTGPMRIIEVDKSTNNGKLGFSVGGGPEGVFVKKISAHAPATVTRNLQAGARVVEVNGVSMINPSKPPAGLIRSATSEDDVVVVVYQQLDAMQWHRVLEESPEMQANKSASRNDSFNADDTLNSSTTTGFSIASGFSSGGGRYTHESSGASSSSNPFPGPPSVGPLVQVDLSTDALGRGLGLSLIGSASEDLGGVFVNQVNDNSLAARSGIRVGDRIIAVNDRGFIAGSHQDAALSLAARPLSLLLLRPSPADWDAICSVVERRIRDGQTKRPDVGRARAASLPRFSPQHSTRVTSGDVIVVHLFKQQGESLGLMLAGGTDTDLGAVFVSNIVNDKLADRDGRLSAGDRVLEVCGVSALFLRQGECANILRAAAGDITIVAQRLATNDPIRDEIRSLLSVNTRFNDDSGITNSSFGNITSPATESFADVSSRSQLPPALQAKPRFVQVTRQQPNQSLGLRIVGDINPGPVFVSQVVEGGLVDRQGGVQVGDRLLSVNGTPTTQIKHADVMNLIKAAGNVISLEVAEDSEGWQNYQRKGFEPTSPAKKRTSRKGNRLQFKIPIQSDVPLGFHIAGFRDPNTNDFVGHCISHVNPGSPAAASGLQFGDKLLTINGKKVTGSQEEISRLLQKSRNNINVTVERDEELARQFRQLIGANASTQAQGPSLEQVRLQRSSLQESFGFALGSSDDGQHVVSRLGDTGSAVGRLQAGDQIVSVNGQQVTGMAREVVVQRLSGLLDVMLVVQRESTNPTVAGEVSRQAPPATSEETIHVTIARERYGQSFGFGLGTAATKEHVVSTVSLGGPSQGRLEVGDKIVSVNGRPTDNMSHDELIDIFCSCLRLSLAVSRTVTATGAVAAPQLRRTPSGRVSGISSADRRLQFTHTQQSIGKDDRVSDPFEVHLQRSGRGKSYGFNFGTTADGVHHIVTHVNPAGVAAGQLKVGDFLLAVNGASLNGLSHNDCVGLALASDTVVRLTVARAEKNRPQLQRTPSGNWDAQVDGGASRIHMLQHQNSIGRIESDDDDQPDILSFLLQRVSVQSSFGFSVSTSADGVHLVTDVKPYGPASGQLELGDQVLEVNNELVSALSHNELLDKVSTASTTVQVKVARTKAPSKLGRTMSGKLALFKQGETGGGLTTKRITKQDSFGGRRGSVSSVPSTPAIPEVDESSLAHQGNTVVVLERTREDQFFGFKLGTSDTGAHCITQVSSGGLADGNLFAGDVIVAINDTVVTNLPHHRVLDVATAAGNRLVFRVQRDQQPELEVRTLSIYRPTTQRSFGVRFSTTAAGEHFISHCEVPRELGFRQVGQVEDGDIVVAINGTNVEECTHAECMAVAKAAQLELHVSLLGKAGSLHGSPNVSAATAAAIAEVQAVRYMKLERTASGSLGFRIAGPQRPQHPPGIFVTNIDSPEAAESGLQVGHEIIKVRNATQAWQDVEAFTLDRFVLLLRELGNTVILAVRENPQGFAATTAMASS